MCVCVCVWKRERETKTETERQTDRQNSNSKTLFYKDCSLGSVKNLTRGWLGGGGGGGGGERERGRDGMKIKRISYESECLTHHLVTKKSRKLQVHTSVKPKTKRTAIQFFEFIHNKNKAFSNNDVLFVCFYMQPCSSLSHNALWITT